MAQPELQQARLNLEATREVRRRLEQHAKRIGTADGTNKEALREWIRGVEYAAVWTGANDLLVLEMVGYLTTGGLATALRHYVNRVGPQRNWEEAKQEITAAFLDEDEREFLRAKVDKIVQNPYEDSREYGRRYRNAVGQAYDPADLQLPLVSERLSKQFVQGLRDREVRTQVFLRRPQALPAAIDAANNAARAVGLAETSQRVEEPMDIGAVPLPPPPPASPAAQDLQDLYQVLKTLQGEVKSLRKLVTLPAPAAPQREKNPSPRPPRRAQYEQRRQPPRESRACYECGAPDHFARNCPRRRQDIVAAVQAAMASQGN